jgi:hypothetical protein
MSEKKSPIPGCGMGLFCGVYTLLLLMLLPCIAYVTVVHCLCTLGALLMYLGCIAYVPRVHCLCPLGASLMYLGCIAYVPRVHRLCHYHASQVGRLIA